MHQHGAPFDQTRHMNSPMSGYAGNTETGTLLHRHGIALMAAQPYGETPLFNGPFVD
jgi:hypothetical protein